MACRVMRSSIQPVYYVAAMQDVRDARLQLRRSTSLQHSSSAVPRHTHGGAHLDKHPSGHNSSDARDVQLAWVSHTSTMHKPRPRVASDGAAPEEAARAAALQRMSLAF